MEINVFLRGLIIGFSIAAPVGPIGVLCIRRTLAEGRVSGFISGLGAATADAIYGSIAGFGLTFISNILIRQEIGLRLIGGIFICYLGIKTFLTHPSKQLISSKEAGLISAYISTFFLTLTNPLTLLFFTAIFAGLGVGSESRNYVSAGLMVLGVFAGSALWWFILSRIASLFETKFNLQGLRWVNRISGLIILAFGLFALLSLISSPFGGRE
jgi:threonine/homoserine/homoserine lactone efflux protein